MGTTRTNVRPLVLALLAATAAATAGAIVTIDPATGGPILSDPHVVDGPFDLNDATGIGTLPELPPIETRGIIELDLYFVKDPFSPRTCSGAVVDLPDGTRAVLTAAHCPRNGPLEQITTELPALLGGTEPYETCHLDDPGCDLDDFVKVHPLYQSVNRGYDLAVITFTDPIPGFVQSYEVAETGTDPLFHKYFVKFGYGCPGYGGTGVDESDFDVYDHVLRWAANRWEQPGLGVHGLTLMCNGGTIDFQNNDTQLVYDFDNLILGDQNMFWFYGNGTFDPNTNPPFYDNRGFEWGVPNAEGIACPGDSGGPNFIWDAVDQQWVIAGVTSYIYRMNDDWGGFVGNSDLDGPGPGYCDRNMTFGEFGGDARIDQALLSEVLGATAQPVAPAQGALQHGLGPAPSPPALVKGQ